MNHSKPISAAIVLTLLLAGGLAQAQPGGGPGAAREYDPATETTMSGVVERVERVPHGSAGGAEGVHLQLKTDSGETIEVRLGPSWFVDEQPLKIAPGDRIEVRGSALVEGGKPALIAAQVTRGSQTLVLRNPAGVPEWAGRGRKAR